MPSAFFLSYGAATDDLLMNGYLPSVLKLKAPSITLPAHASCKGTTGRRIGLYKSKALFSYQLVKGLKSVKFESSLNSPENISITMLIG